MKSDGLALLETAAAVLQELAPRLGGDERYAALLVANGVETSRRAWLMESRAGSENAPPPEAVAAIRSGAHDDDAALHARLTHSAVLRAWVANPASVTDAERSEHLGDLS
jgi:hypothetical protein